MSPVRQLTPIYGRRDCSLGSSRRHRHPQVGYHRNTVCRSKVAAVRPSPAFQLPPPLFFSRSRHTKPLPVYECHDREVSLWLWRRRPTLSELLWAIAATAAHNNYEADDYPAAGGGKLSDHDCRVPAARQRNGCSRPHPCRDSRRRRCLSRDSCHHYSSGTALNGALHDQMMGLSL